MRSKKPIGPKTYDIVRETILDIWDKHDCPEYFRIAWPQVEPYLPKDIDRSTFYAAMSKMQKNGEFTVVMRTVIGYYGNALQKQWLRFPAGVSGEEEDLKTKSGMVEPAPMMPDHVVFEDADTTDGGLMRMPKPERDFGKGQSVIALI